MPIFDELKHYKIFISENIKVIFVGVLAIIGLVGWSFGFLDFIPKLSTPLGDFEISRNTASVNTAVNATSTINIAEIIGRIKRSKTSKEAEDLLDLYKDTPIIGTGEYSNEWKSSGDESRIGITIAGNMVQCNFDKDWKKKLQLYQLGNQINFSGTFRSIEFRGYYFVDQCSLTK
jgi:hypothetical protein